MLRIAICDDQTSVRENLREYVRRYCGEHGVEAECSLFCSGDDLLKHYPPHLDVLFLDIRMNAVNGMEAAHYIRTFDDRVCIVFITNLQEYALEGYSVRAFGFLKKPVTYAALCRELSGAIRLIHTLQEKGRTVCLKNAGQYERLAVGDILYCEVSNHTVQIRLKDQLRQFRSQMKELESLLSPYGFFRCHAAYLVNCDHISAIDTASVTMSNGETVPLSQHRRKAFLSEVSKYMGERM